MSVYFFNTDSWHNISVDSGSNHNRFPRNRTMACFTTKRTAGHYFHYIDLRCQRRNTGIVRFLLLKIKNNTFSH